MKVKYSIIQYFNPDFTGQSCFTSRQFPSQEISHISWKLKVHCHIHNSPTTHVPILSQTYPVQALSSQFMKIHSDITLLSTTRLSKWSLSLRFPKKNPVCISLLPYMSHVPHPTHSLGFGHPNNIW